MLVEPETGGNTVYLREGQTESSPAAPPGPGSVPLRLGHYLLTEELARGGAAIVYRGHDPALHRQVAVKILQAGPLASREAVRRLFLEARPGPTAAGGSGRGLTEQETQEKAGGRHPAQR